MFQDARQRLTENGYNLALVDEDLFTLETAPRRMEEGYVLRITVNVLTSADGVDLLSRAEWAQSKDAGEADWHEAAWTQGPSRAAFEQTILAVAEIPHTSMLVAKAAELADVSEMDGGTR